MSEQKKRTITQYTYLKALGLWTLASEHRKKMEEL